MTDKTLDEEFRDLYGMDPMHPRCTGKDEAPDCDEYEWPTEYTGQAPEYDYDPENDWRRGRW